MDIVLSWLNERRCLVLSCRLLLWVGIRKEIDLFWAWITKEIDLFWEGIGLSQILLEGTLPHLTNQNNTLNCTNPRIWPCTFHLGSKGLNMWHQLINLFPLSCGNWKCNCCDIWVSVTSSEQWYHRNLNIHLVLAEWHYILIEGHSTLPDWVTFLISILLNEFQLTLTENDRYLATQWQLICC